MHVFFVNLADVLEKIVNYFQKLAILSLVLTLLAVLFIVVSFYF